MEEWEKTENHDKNKEGVDGIKEQLKTKKEEKVTKRKKTKEGQGIQGYVLEEDERIMNHDNNREKKE